MGPSEASTSKPPGAPGTIIRMKIKGISVIGRNTQGVRLINVEKGEKVVGVAHLAEED